MDLTCNSLKYVANPTSADLSNPLVYMEDPLCGYYCPTQQQSFDVVEDNLKFNNIINNNMEFIEPKTQQNFGDSYY
jgi:hypothetical protein